MKTQYRTVDFIIDYINIVFYNGVLNNAPDIKIQNRLYAIIIQIYLYEKFPGRPEASAMLIKIYSKTIKNNNILYYNLKSASAIINIVEEILTRKVVLSDAITIMAFYKI